MAVGMGAKRVASVHIVVLLWIVGGILVVAAATVAGGGGLEYSAACNGAADPVG